MFIEAESYVDVYKKIRESMKDAIMLSPRGLKIKELQNVMISVKNPRSRLGYHEKRKYNLYFNVAELLSIIGNYNSVEFLSYFNKNVKQFSDNGIDFYGAYGPRLGNQWLSVIRRLTEDNDTRQAVMTIYRGNDDLHVKTKDVPCTLNLHFMVRDNKLNLTTYMRSNDLFWGFQYDFFNFTLIQEMVFNEIKMFIPNLELGTYTHVVTSLHVYEKHFVMLDEIEEMEEIEMPEIKYLFFTYCSMVNRVLKVIDTFDVESIKMEDNCFINILKYYRTRKDKDKLPEWSKKFIK